MRHNSPLRLTIMFLSSIFIVTGEVLASSGDITRQDFVKSLIESSCESCREPNAIDAWKYEKTLFSDISREDAGYYCSQKAAEKGYIEGYDAKTPCQDGSNPTGMKFCPNNAITKIEASAILLRQGSLWNEQRDRLDTSERLLIPGLDPRWSRYALLAIKTGLLTGSMDEISWNEAITQSEWSRMKTIFDSLKLCSNDSSFIDGFGLDIVTKKNGNSYAFEPRVDGRDTTLLSYEWDIIRRSVDNPESSSTSKNASLSGITLQAREHIGITLTARDRDGRESIAFLSLGEDGAYLNPIFPTIYGGSPTSVVGKIPDSSVIWHDNATSPSKGDIWSSLYSVPGLHHISLIDTKGETVLTKMITLAITQRKDIDNDGVANEGDKCPNLSGDQLSNGCPPIKLYTNNSVGFVIGAGGLGSYDASLNPNASTNSGTSNNGSTNYSIRGGVIGGGVRGLYDGAGACERTSIKDHGSLDIVAMCNSCPCAQTFASSLEIKACDIIYPAFLSNDKSTLYSQGQGGEIHSNFGF